nr:reverse transcriptase domain-containing protein [Tanacetum cinerariifolium]
SLGDDPGKLGAAPDSVLVSNPSSNPTPSMNLNPKGRNRRRFKQRIENFNLEELSPHIVTMADQRTMAQLLQAPTEGYEDALVVPTITADNFDLKHGLLTLVQNKQFFGHDKEDSHAHVRYFNKITSTLKFLNVLNTSIKLMIFPFSLEGTAQIWLEKEPPRLIFTWDDLVSKFINQFFPPSKTTNLRNEITNFQQRFNESFNQDSLNSAAGGNFLDKMPRECLAIIESKSKVYYLCNKPVVTKSQNQSPAPVKAVEESSVTCDGAHCYRNCTATDGNVYRDNIQEFVSQASADPAYQAPAPQTQGVSKEDFLAYVKANDAVMRNMQTQGMAECLALANLSFSINLMPFSIWKRIYLPDLTPTCMILELADRSISRPVGVEEDVYVKVGLFHFLADFVVMDFDADPRVPLILGRLFLKTGRALIDVFKGELTLRVGKKAITFNLDQSSRYSANYSDMTAKRIDIIYMTCEDDFLLEEVDAFLAIEDKPTLSEFYQPYLDPEGDILLLEAFLNDDPSLPPPNQRNYLPEVRKANDTTSRKRYPFIFSPECVDAFQTLKRKPTEALILIAPNWDMPFELMCDASYFAIGAVLGQRQDKHFRPIHYASKTMTESIVYMDHFALKYLFARKDSKAILLRWVLLLKEFTFKVIDTKGAETWPQIICPD